MTRTWRRSSPSSNRSEPLRLAVGIAMLAVACAPPPAPLPESDVLTGIEPCPRATFIDVDRSLRVRILIGPDVTTDRAIELVTDGAKVLNQLGIGIHLDDVVEVSNGSILGGTITEIERRVRSEATTTDSERGGVIAAETAIAPIRAFLENHAVPAHRRIDVAVLAALADDTSITRRVIGDVAGIGVAPETADGLPPRSLPSYFTPTVFLGLDVLDELVPADIAIVVAHELAHALGLRHDPRPWNLMEPTLRGCLPGLDASQAATIRSSPAVRP